MGCGTRDQFKISGRCMASPRRQHISFEFRPPSVERSKSVHVKLRYGPIGGLKMVPFHFAIRQILEALKVPFEARAEQRVAELRGEGGGDSQRKPPRQSGLGPLGHQAAEREVTLKERFEEPGFFVKLRSFRMPNPRQVGVENKG